MPSISIIAPVYGVEKYIHQFLESIKSQSFEDIEVIMVDDGSLDNCPAILDEFAKDDPRCKVIHQPNGGVSVARNTGIAAATGEYIYIVDSDDWLAENALSILWSEAQKTHADLIYGDWISESNGRSYYQKCFPNAFSTQSEDAIRKLQFAVNANNHRVNLRSDAFEYVAHMGGAPWRGMIRHDIIRENHLRFDPYVRGLGDDVLFSLSLYDHVQKVAYVDKPIYHYRKLDASYSHGYKADYLVTLSRIFEKQEEFLRSTDKDDFAWESFYIRVLIYLDQGMARYFLNENSGKSKAERYREFRETIQSEPYHHAIAKAPVRYMTNRRIKTGAVLLRMKLTGIYWAMYTLKKRKEIQ